VLPRSQNKAFAYVSTIAAGIEASAAAASARQVVNAEEARKDVGDENGQQTFEMSEALGPECAGGGACASSYTSCGIRSLFGEPVPGTLEVAAVVRCSRKVEVIEVETCLWAWTGNGSMSSNSNYKQFKCNGTGDKKGEAFYNTNIGIGVTKEVCGIGWAYKAWAWGHAVGSDVWFGGPGQVSGVWRCVDAYTDAGVEFAEFVST
jgi:hypothetical protein